MLTRDRYELTASDPFRIETNEELTINLALEKLPPCYRTLLSGRVLNNLEEVYQATVKVFSLDMKPLFHTSTDKSGYYQFKNIIPPGLYKVIASAKYYKTSETELININNGTSQKLNFQLKKSRLLINGIVYGKVLEERTNLPIPDADVYITNIDEQGSQYYKTRSNREGQYLIYNIKPNQYLIQAKKTGYTSQEAVKISVDVYSQTMLNFNMIKNSLVQDGTVSGIITADSTPVANIAVFLYSIDNYENENLLQLQKTNEEGYYLFGKLDKGSYIVKASMENGEEYTAQEIID